LLSCSQGIQSDNANDEEQKELEINQEINLNEAFSIIDSSQSTLKSFLLSPLSNEDTLHRYFYDLVNQKIIHNSGLGFFAMIKYAEDFNESGNISIRFYSPNFYPFLNAVYFSQTIDTVLNENINEFLKRNELKYSSITTKDNDIKLTRKMYQEIIGSKDFIKEFNFKLTKNENSAMFIELFVIDKDENVIFSKGHIIEFQLKDKKLEIFNGTFKFDFPKDAI
jgi:hypothetical protein